MRSVTLTRRPVWLEVEAGQLEKIEFNAMVRFWPADKKNIALFLIEFETMPAADVLAAHKIPSSTTIGPYVYLNAPMQSGEFRQAIQLPGARVKRIGMRLWDHQEPVLLEDIVIVASGAKISSEYAVSNEVFLNDLEDFQKQARPDMLALNLMRHDASCNAYCHAICQHWYETIDDVARRAGKHNDVGRINCYFKLDDDTQVPVTVFNGTPAMLRIPESHAKYLEKIGDKARNMIRKAQRQGYVYRKVDPDDYLDDVLAIRTSNPERQGKPIPEYYKIRPTHIIEQPFRSGCKLHGEGFFGIFKDEKLIAYTTIFFYGELGQVNHILGHADHLQEGVMNLLVSEMVREIIEQTPWMRAINYLYPHLKSANAGIGLFKRSIGFLPERVLITHGQQDLRHYFSDPVDEFSSRSSELAEQPSEKKLLRATTSKAVKAAAITSDLIQPPKEKNREAALDLALKLLNGSNPTPKLIRSKDGKSINADVELSDAHVIVFEAVPFDNFQEFLSSGLKSFRKTVPKNSFLLFDFKRAPDQDHVIKPPRLANLAANIFQRRGRRINQDLIEYLSRRFKSVDLSIDDIKTGFKGSDYVVAGVVDYENEGLYRSFDSWLILKKIR